MTIIYGISNCDTVKKAIKWLSTNNINFTFHDFRKDGFDQELLTLFTTKANWQDLINKRSTSYRNLDDAIKENLTAELAQQALLENPTLIKRPVLIHQETLSLGFKDKDYQQIFGLSS